MTTHTSAKITSSMHQEQRPTPAHYWDNTAAVEWRQSGSVQSPQFGVLKIPALLCGLWCHTGFCLWMAICSSPLISSRWWGKPPNDGLSLRRAVKTKLKEHRKHRLIPCKKNKTKKTNYTFVVVAGCFTAIPVLGVFCFVSFSFINLHHNDSSFNFFFFLFFKDCWTMLPAQ